MPPVVIDVRAAKDTRDVVHRAVQAVVEGKLVAFPTETVYGLAANALDEEAVVRLLEIKGRQRGHPLALAIKDSESARDYAPNMGRLAQRFARRCWPGPITLVVDDDHAGGLVHRLPPKVREAVSPQDTIGLRVPSHYVVLDVLRMLTGPLTLTSANRTGQPEAVTAEQVLEAVGESIDLVLDDGPCRFGQPSSVVRVTDAGYEILRAGVVPKETLRRLSSVMVLLVCTGNTCRSPMAEVFCRDMLARRLGCRIDELEQHGVIVVSAGIAAMLGGLASNEAARTVAEMGLDLTDHETQPLTEPLVRHADCIYTMTRSHCEAIVAQWPEAADRARQLSPEGNDISDPIGGTLSRYQHCAAQIREELAKRLEELEL